MSKGDGQAIDLDAQHLLDVAPCGLIVFDDRGILRFANQIFLELIGRADDEERVIGADFSLLMTVGDRIFYQTHLFPMVRLHGRADEIFMTLKAEGDEEIPILANLVRYESENGHLNYGVVVPVRRRREFEHELVEARNRAEEALRNNEALQEAQQSLRHRTRELDRRLSLLKQRNSELQRLSRIFSHDLREPVRKLATFSDLLAVEDHERLSEMGKQAVAKISASAVRMDELISRLQQYLEVDSDQQAWASVDLNDVVRHAEQAAGIRRNDADVVVRSAQLPIVDGYQSQLEVLFIQLFDNSLKFRRQNVTLQIEVDCTVIQNNRFRSVAGQYQYVDCARITISDNGCGFPPRFEEYVFDFLKKIDPESPGVGMGLAICKKIVANHFGDIEVHATPDVGTTVTVVLPLTHDHDE